MTQNAWPADFLREPWAMEPRALQAFMAKIADAIQSARMPAGVVSAAQARGLAIEDGTAVIKVRGALMKSVPWYFAFFDIAATAYPDIEADLAAAIQDPSITAIRLEIDSPGGSSMGLKRVADALFAARSSGKSIRARVDDLMASAAYWLGSQAEEISAGPMANVGSIGAYMTFVDQHVLAHNLGLKVEVISSSELKGAGIPGTQLTPEQRADLQKYVDDITAQFVQDVARGRGAAESKARAWATGGMWLSEDALKMGLVDRLESPAAMAQRLAKSKAPSTSLSKVSAAHVGTAAMISAPSRVEELPNKERDMTDQEIQAAREQAAKDAVAAERKRQTDLGAAFPKDPAFAMRAVAEGWSVVEARAKYADVLEAARAEDQKTLAKVQDDLEKAKKPAQPSAGAEPVRVVGEPGGPQSSKADFMAVTREYREKQGFAMVDGKKVWNCSIVDAMKHIVKTQPELHKDFLAKSAARAPEVKARKEALGMKD